MLIAGVCQEKIGTADRLRSQMVTLKIRALHQERRSRRPSTSPASPPAPDVTVLPHHRDQPRIPPRPRHHGDDRPAHLHYRQGGHGKIDAPRLLPERDPKEGGRPGANRRRRAQRPRPDHPLVLQVQTGTWRSSISKPTTPRRAAASGPSRSSRWSTWENSSRGCGRTASRGARNATSVSTGCSKSGRRNRGRVPFFRRENFPRSRRLYFI